MTTQTIALFNNPTEVWAALEAIVAAIALVAAITFGARRWQTSGGKAITIIAGLLLLVLAVGVAFVLLVAKAMEGAIRCSSDLLLMRTLQHNPTETPSAT